MSEVPPLPPDGPAATGGEDARASDRDLRDFLDDERAWAAAAERTRLRRLREQAGEEATLAGTLLDLAEQGSAVGVRCGDARVHQGVVIGVGADYCALRVASGEVVYLALSGVGAVRPAPGVAVGDPGTRAAGGQRTLAEVLGRLAPEHPRVAVRLVADPDPIAGQLRTVGHDVAELRLDGPGRPRCFLRLPAVVEVVVDPG